MPSGKKLLFFDCFSGLSGDMACAALADLTGKHEVGLQAARDLGFKGVRVTVVGKTSFGISGKGFEVSPGPRDNIRRDLRAITALFENSKLPGYVIGHSIEAFTKLAMAESQIHGVAPEEVEFHEIGAVDSIIDIATFFSFLHVLGPGMICCSDLPPGKGSVRTDHGTYPIPAPATLELLKGTGAVFAQAEFPGEAVTPTGAALMVTAGARFEPMPPMTVSGTGYGIGRMIIPERPNVLRILLGDALFSPAGDRIVTMETTVDDMNPQHVEILMDRIFEMGALDFYISPVQMKKNRPGWIFTTIAGEQDVGGIVSALFSLTTTTGVRITETGRLKLRRDVVMVETAFGPIAAKVIEFPDGCFRAVPEYDDIKRIAAEKMVPVMELVKEVEEVWRKRG